MASLHQGKASTQTVVPPFPGLTSFRGQRQSAKPVPPLIPAIPHQDFFRLISDSMIDLVAVVDKAGRRVYSSPSYSKVLGDPAKLVGTNSFREIHPADRERVKKLFKKTFSTGIGQRAEYRFLLPNGSARHIESQGSVVRDYLGKPLYLVIVSRDVTEQREAEQELVETSAREQRKIGQDFYERLGQDLTGVGFMSKVLEEALAEKALPEAAQATEIVKFVTKAINQTRHLSRGLLSIDLQVNGLSGALEELTDNLSNLFNVPCLFRHDRRVRISDPTATIHLYRIAEEAMNDAIKNRRATRVIVGLTNKNKQGVLTVTDNGLDGTSRDSRIGLKLMRYRARFIGVDLQVKTLTEGGRVLTCAFGTTV